jgi:hypothetical protein
MEAVQDILADETLYLEAKADRLIQAALEAGETDNQTLILWQYTPGWWRSLAPLTARLSAETVRLKVGEKPYPCVTEHNDT